MRQSESEAVADQAEEPSTAEALADLRSPLGVVESESDASKVADALTSIAESARALADRIKAISA